MSLVARLRALGARLGLLHAERPAGQAPAGPAKIATRVVSLDQLLRELRPPGDEAAALDADLAALCARAGVQAPPHGWGVERLAQALREPGLQALRRDAVQARILERLAADGATPEQLVADACARDAALDAYAEAARAALARRASERQARRDRLAEELARLDAEDRAERARWEAWWAGKLANEEVMAWAISHLLERPVITIDRDPGA